MQTHVGAADFFYDILSINSVNQRAEQPSILLD